MTRIVLAPCHCTRVLPALLLAGLLGACAHAPQRNPLAEWVPSPNQDLRRPVLIVLHYTDQASVQQSLDTLRSHNSKGKVSAHYLIGRDGRRYQLVSDERRAWHGGAGRWGTLTDINSASIGIELDNDGRSPFQPAQIDSLLVLLEDLCTRLRIPRTQVVGHEDFAPTRKVDPGPLFPWRQLAAAGFGRWPAADAPPAPDGFDPWQALALIGYPLDDRAATLRAFHHHYRGNDATAFDAEDLRILHALIQPSLAPPQPAPQPQPQPTSTPTPTPTSTSIPTSTPAPAPAPEQEQEQEQEQDVP